MSKSIAFIARLCSVLCMHDIVLANLSVRPARSVTLWHCIKINAYIVKLFPPSGRGTTWVYIIPKGTRSAVALNTRGWKIAIFDRNRRLSRKRYKIGPWLLGCRSICQFQWPGVTLKAGTRRVNFFMTDLHQYALYSLTYKMTKLFLASQYAKGKILVCVERRGRS